MRIPLRTAWLEIGAGFHLLFAAAATYALPDGLPVFDALGLTPAYGATLLLLAASSAFALHPLSAVRSLRRLLFFVSGGLSAAGAVWFAAAGAPTALTALQAAYAAWLFAAAASPRFDRVVVAAGERRVDGLPIVLGAALVAVGAASLPSARGAASLAVASGSAVAGAMAIASELRWASMRAPSAAFAAAAFLAHAFLARADAAAAAALMAAGAALLVAVTRGGRLSDAAEDVSGATPRQREMLAFERASEIAIWVVAAFAAVFVHFVASLDVRLYFASALVVAVVVQFHYRLRPISRLSERNQLLPHAVIILASILLIEATGGPLGPFMPLAYIAVFGSGFMVRPALSVAVAGLYAGYVAFAYLLHEAHARAGALDAGAAERLLVIIALLGIGIFTGWNARRRLRADEALMAANARLANALREAIRERERVERQAKELKRLNANLVDMRSALMNVLEDVEESKRAIEVERRREKASFNALGEGVIASDASGVVFLCNPKAAELLGTKPDALVGKRIERVLRLLTEEENVLQTGAFEAAFGGKSAALGHRLLLMRDDGGRVPVAGTVAPYLDEAGRIEGIVVAFRDVTVEREIDRQKSDFISIASHQLRTPLSALRWFLDMLLAGDAGPLKTRQKEYLGDMAVSVERMIKLVGDLLNVTRIESGRVKPVPTDVEIAEFVDSIVREHLPMTRERGINLNVVVALGARTFYADPALVRQAVVNVLSNALMYTPTGGRIALHVSVKGDEAIFEVRDTGFGIPKSQQHRVFDKFFRGENAVMRETKGSGLGLYVAKTVADLSGGRIWFESDEKKGTTFWLAFPTAPKPLPRKASDGMMGS